MINVLLVANLMLLSLQKMSTNRNSFIIPDLGVPEIKKLTLNRPQKMMLWLIPRLFLFLI